MGMASHLRSSGKSPGSKPWPSSRCVLYIFVTAFLTVQVGLCVFYVAQTRICDNGRGGTTLVNVDHDWPSDKLKRNTKTDTVKQKQDYESAAAAETSNEEEEENKMMKDWMDNDQDNVNSLVDGDGDIKTLEASNFKIFRVPIDSKEDQSVYQFKKIPVVDFKKLKNQTKGSLGLLLRSLHTRLKNDVPKMLPEPGHVFHEKRKRFTIMTSTNAGFLDFTENWLLSLKRIGLNHSISIIAEDAVAYRYLTTKYDGGNIQIFATSSNYSSIKAFQFRSAEYKSLVNRRAEYMLHFLNKGIDVLAVDVDAYWFRDPMEVIRGGFDVYDMWVSLGADVKKTPCPCCMYLKSKPNVIQMVKAWSERMQRLEGKENDQEALGQIMWKFKTMPLHHGMRVNAARLDNDLFPTGQVLFKPSWWWEHGKRVYVVHANRIGNHDKKVAFFREYGLWIIEPYNVDLT